MNGTTSAFVFSGLLLTLIGLFISGHLGPVTVGVVSLVFGGVLQSIGRRDAR